MVLSRHRPGICDRLRGFSPNTHQRDDGSIVAAPGPVAHAAEEYESALSGEEIRPVLGWLQTHRQEAGDLIYTIGSHQIRVFLLRFALGLVQIFNLGSVHLMGFAVSRLRKVKNYKRVWVIYSRGDKTTTDFILHQFGEFGLRTGKFTTRLRLFKING